MPQDISRRDFFQTAFGTAELAVLAHTALAQQPSATGIPTRRLGRTNEQVSILCLGGGHIGIMERQDAIGTSGPRPHSTRSAAECDRHPHPQAGPN